MGKDQELIEAARNGDIAIVEKILLQRAKRSGPLASLRRGSGANAQDGNGFSALHHAALNRHKDIVKLLLTHEASTNIVDLQGSSPLHLAAWSGNEEIVKLLLTHGPSVPNVNLMNQSLDTPVSLAAQFGHTGVVKLLLEHGANPVILNSRQESSLDLAAHYGRLETVQLLLKSHPELLATYTSPTLSKHVFHHTPLHMASRNGHRSVVEVLLKAGFEVNIRTSQGTALHEAALCGKVDVVKGLLEGGIDVTVTDNMRRTAVDRLNEVGLQTPVAKEIAELIRGALKKFHVSGKGTSPVPASNDSINKSDEKLLGSEKDSLSAKKVSPKKPPKLNNFNRDQTRRSLDVYTQKGPDFDRSLTLAGPPKKPPRRNLSASPTHPDLGCEPYELSLPNMGRNKSLDEGVYAERWRQSGGGFETSQSTDSIDTSSTLDHANPNSCAKSDIAFFNGVSGDELNNKSNSQHARLDRNNCSSNQDSVAHLNARDAKSKSEQNVCPSGQRLTAERKDSKVNDAQENLQQQQSGQNADSTPNDQRAKPIVITVKPLVKGPKPAIAPKPIIAPKPKFIKRQTNSCDNVLNEHKTFASNKLAQKSISVLHASDVDQSWDSLAKFMNSLNESSRKSPLLMSQVGKWLAGFNLSEYETLLVTNGFDDLNFLGGNILDESSLLEIGMLNAVHRTMVAEQANKLEVTWPRAITAEGVPVSVEKWLQELHLEQYTETFRKNLYTQPERLLHLWNDELITVLEIDALGHRRRLVEAGIKVSGSSRTPSRLSSSSPRFSNGIDEPSDGPLPLRDPNHLVSGVSSALKTAWRHQPETLIDGSVTYRANYVGWSLVQEFSTTESIQKAIQQIRAQESSPAAGQERALVKVVNLGVTLIVSASVFSWYNAKTKSLVREHDIGSIQCTCQASDDLRHLALVTKVPDQPSHSCHVFCLDSVEIATEAILTLGQAFEVAYQLALVNQTQNRENRGHVRSKSATQLSTKSVGRMRNTRDKYQNICSDQSHSRSHSVADIPVPLLSSASTSASNSPQVSSSHSKKEYRLPRAESFSYGAQSPHLSRAPIVSKEEL